MPLRRGRVGRVGVVRAPVAKAAVVGAAVRPGPAPVRGPRSWVQQSPPAGVAAASTGRSQKRTVKPEVVCGRLVSSGYGDSRRTPERGRLASAGTVASSGRAPRTAAMYSP